MSSKTASKRYEGYKQRRTPVKNPGAPCRKASAKLNIRVRDYSAMVERMGTKFVPGSFHMPGSRQR